VVPHAELMSFARKVAQDISPLGTVAEILLLYGRGADLSLAQRLDLEAQYTARRSFNPEEFRQRGSETSERKAH
jgi:enoyl-CoA hydratase/carnithine racemase